MQAPRAPTHRVGDVNGCVGGVVSAMKCNPLRWLWGVLPIAALAYLATYLEHARIERDLGSRVEAALSGTGLRWARTGFAGRDGVLTGRATEETDQQKAIAIARDTWGVRVVENRSELLERVDSYAWWASRAGNRVTLGGLVPNDNTRESIVNLAKSSFPNVTITDEMRLARGVPSQDTWLTGIGFGLQQLQGIRAGEARLDGLSLTVAGEAATQASYGAIKTALAGAVPRGVRLADDRVTPPVVKPYTWDAVLSGGQLVLSGHVPNARARADVEAAAKAALPAARIADRMSYGDGAPAGFVGVATGVLKGLARLEEGKANIRDTALAVEGLAADEATAETARRAVRAAAPQAYRVSEQIRFREVAPPPPPPAQPTVSPYTGGVELDGGRVVLTGHVPTEAMKVALEQTARARFPGRTIDNRLLVAAGAPEGWQRCLEGGMLGLARAGNGRLTLSDRKLDIAVRTEDPDLAAALPGDVRGAVAGACDPNTRVDLAVQPEPEGTWRAVLGRGELVLGGDVVSETARAALVAQARRQFPNVQVRDEMRLAENRSRAWPRAAEIGLASLGELDRGEAVLTRQQLTVTGESRFEPQIVARVRERIERDMPRGYAGREQIAMQRPAPPPAAAPPPPATAPTAPTVAALCQQQLRDTVAAGRINFQRARADLTEDSRDTLDRLAAIARACPRVRIDVEGHTDAEGTPERNQRLSDRRAQAVVDYLVRAGVDAKILTAIGYGETRPLVPNDTAENRAQNRRIGFTVSE